MPSTTHIIHKRDGTRNAHSDLAPNLLDYAKARAAFSWRSAREQLAGLPGGNGLNIAREAVDRHAAGPLGRKPALRCLSRSGERTELCYGQLRDLMLANLSYVEDFDEDAVGEVAL